MNNLQKEKFKCDIPVGTKVLVTGGSGFTGSVLVRKLAEVGVVVHGIIRESSNISHLSDCDVKWFRGNVYDKGVIDEACEGVEYIFHMATAYRQGKTSGNEFEKVHILSTQLLADKALSLPNFKRFIHVSTIGVHGHIEDDPATEDHPFAPGDDYQKTKMDAEIWIKKFGDQNKLPYTIIRPSGIFGPTDKRLLKLFKMACKPYLILLGRGQCFYHLIHVDDLANAMILSATKKDALGESFIIGNDVPITLEQFSQVVAQVRNKKIKTIRLPAWPFFMMGFLCELICTPFGIEPPIYRRRVAFFTKDRKFNTSKMRDVLGYVPGYSNEEGIVDTMKWYLENKWI